jgi:hypothetical protein
MPFIDAAAAQVLRWSRRMPWLEHVLDLGGWMLAPLALVTLIVTGELLALGWRLEGLPPFATLRGMHLFSAEVLLVVIAYRAVRRSVAFARWAHRPGVLARLPRPEAVDWTGLAIRGGAWGSLLLLLLSGLERHAQLRYGWSASPPGDGALWPVVHRVAVPYFYAFLLLTGYLRLRRSLPSLREYLVRQH